MSRAEPWEAAAIRCPFYLTSWKRSVLCEGHGEGMKTETQFKTISQKEMYLGIYCEKRYEECPVYVNAMKKY